MEECRWILSQEAQIPNSPVNWRIVQHMGTQKISKTETYETTNEFGHVIRMERDVQVTKHNCTIQIFWRTPLSNGALIEKYEARYRADGEKQKLMSGNQRKWQVQTSSHAKNRLEQGITIPNLETQTPFIIMLRSLNSSGYSQWTEDRCITLATP